MPPSVLFINRVYPPDAGATGQVLAELAEALCARGWCVTVVACGRTGADQTPPKDDGTPTIRVVRAGGEQRQRNNLALRAFGYLLLYPRLAVAAWRAGRHDIVITMTDPPLHLVLGPFIARLAGARPVHWAQDLYPEVAEALGVLRKDGRLARMLRSLSTRALRRQDRIVTLGRCMKAQIAARGVSAERIRVIPNWADTDAIAPLDHGADPFRARHDLGDRFIVMYSGNIGLAHPFEEILDAAAELARSTPDVLFLFVGDGPKRVALETEVNRRPLNNVRFIPPQPKESLSESLGAADLHIACMEPSLAGLLVPSKVYGILAAGRPCLFVGPRNSEAARLIEESGAGDVVENPTGSTVADAIRRMRDDPDRRRDTGAAARKAALSVDLNAAANAFDNLLHELLRDRPKAAITGPGRQGS